MPIAVAVPIAKALIASASVSLPSVRVPSRVIAFMVCLPLRPMTRSIDPATARSYPLVIPWNVIALQENPERNVALLRRESPTPSRDLHRIHQRVRSDRTSELPHLGDVECAPGSPHEDERQSLYSVANSASLSSQALRASSCCRLRA